MMISARDFILRTQNPSEREIRVAMSGNLCRCTGYVGIVRAIERVIEDRRTRGLTDASHGRRSALGPAGAGHGKATADDGRQVAKAAATKQVAAPAQAPASMLRAEFADFVPQATFEQNFVVNHPIDEVWAFFGRVKDVAACLPGASVTDEMDGREISGMMRVRVGPIAAEFGGIAQIERNPSLHSGTIRGAGRDVRSSSATRGVIDYRLARGDDARMTRVQLSVGYTLTGARAQFSRSNLVRDIANRLTAAFARNVEARLSAPEGEVQPAAAQELNAGSLVFSVLAERIKALFRRLFRR
jgi:carbon-monoxide dehydrogenase small subunit